MDQSKFEDWISQASSLSQDQRVFLLSRLASQRESVQLPSELSSKGDGYDAHQSKRRRTPIKTLVAWNSRFSYIVFMSILTGVFLAVAFDSWSKGLFTALTLPLLGLGLIWVNGLLGGLSSSELVEILFKHRDSYLANRERS